MTVIIPEISELRSGLLEHLHARPDNRIVIAVYLASLSEWGLIELNDYGDLIKLLPNYGSAEINEVSLGPDYLDRTPGLRGEMGQDEAARASKAESKHATQSAYGWPNGGKPA